MFGAEEGLYCHLGHVAGVDDTLGAGPGHVRHRLAGSDYVRPAQCVCRRADLLSTWSLSVGVVEHSLGGVGSAYLSILREVPGPQSMPSIMRRHTDLTPMR